MQSQESEPRGTIKTCQHRGKRSTQPARTTRAGIGHSVDLEWWPQMPARLPVGRLTDRAIVMHGNGRAAYVMLTPASRFSNQVWSRLSFSSAKAGMKQYSQPCCWWKGRIASPVSLPLFAAASFDVLSPPREVELTSPPLSAEAFPIPPASLEAFVVAAAAPFPVVVPFSSLALLSLCVLTYLLMYVSE